MKPIFLLIASLCMSSTIFSQSKSNVYFDALDHIIHHDSIRPSKIDTLYITDDFDICEEMPKRCGEVVLTKVKNQQIRDILDRKGTIIIYKLSPIVAVDKSLSYVLVVPLSYEYKNTEKKTMEALNGGGYRVYFNIDVHGLYIFNSMDEYGI